MRKLHLYNYFISCIFNIMGWLGVVAALALAMLYLWKGGVSDLNLGFVPHLLVIFICAACIGRLAGVFILGMIIASFGVKIQGWPFKVGDQVWILAGKYKGKLATIHKTLYKDTWLVSVHEEQTMADGQIWLSSLNLCWADKAERAISRSSKLTISA